VSNTPRPASQPISMPPQSFPWLWVGIAGIMGVVFLLLIIMGLLLSRGETAVVVLPTVTPKPAATWTATFTPEPAVTWTPTSMPQIIADSETATPEPPTSTPQPTETLIPPTETPKPKPPTQTQNSNSDMVRIPAGEFVMGVSAEVGLAECKKLRNKSEECQRDWFTNEEPEHTVYLNEYYIDKYETTNAQYAACVKAGKCSEPHEKSSTNTVADYYGNAKYANYPVIKIDWTQAKSYCEFAGKRLPTEAEWAKAARGTDKRNYPWGNEFDGTKLNFCDQNCSFDWANKSYDDGYTDTSPVGSYELGQSVYGVYDMGGNVWEWTSSDYKGYPYIANDGREKLLSNNSKVLRSGSWYDYGYLSRVSFRIGIVTSLWHYSIGSRCVR